jgi:hypothetical protein
MLVNGLPIAPYPMKMSAAVGATVPVVKGVLCANHNPTFVTSIPANLA